MIRLWLADFEGFCSIEGGVNAPNAPPCQPTSLPWSERWMFACHPLFPVCPHQSAAMWLRSEPFVPHEALPPPPRPQGNVDRVNLQLVHIKIHKWLPLCVCVCDVTRVLTHVPIYSLFIWQVHASTHVRMCRSTSSGSLHYVYTIVYGCLGACECTELNLAPWKWLTYMKLDLYMHNTI